MSKLLDYTGLQYYHGKVQAEISQLGLNWTGFPIAQTGSNGQYINCTGNPGSTISLTPSTSGGYPNFHYYIQECEPGEHIIVNGTGTSTGLLWCFLTSDNKKISAAGGGATGENLDLTVPATAGKVIINDRTGLGVQIYKPKSLIPNVANRVTALEEGSTELVEELAATDVKLSGIETKQYTHPASGYGVDFTFDGLTEGRIYRLTIAPLSWSVSGLSSTNALVVGGINPSTGQMESVYYQKYLSQAVSGTITVELPIEFASDFTKLGISIASVAGVEFTAILEDLGADNLVALDNRVDMTEAILETVDNGKEVIPVQYIIHSEVGGSTEEKADMAAHLQPGQYGLIEPVALYKAAADGSISKATLHGATVDTGAELAKYYYAYCGAYYEYISFNNSRWALSRLRRIPIKGLYPRQSFHIVDSDNELVEHNANEWSFSKDSDNNYTIMAQCYAYLDALVSANPLKVIKYDPMASADYTEGGITVKALSGVRSKMVNAGFSAYPVYAQGIAAAGSYTIGSYTVNLLKTPAYKTFIYRLVSNDINNPGNTSAPKRNLLIQAGMHSAEVISQICSCLFASEILSENINAYQLLSHYDIWIVPCLNGYGGFHNSSLTACGVNGNRNYATPWWLYNADDLENCGYAAGDQFETRLSMCLIDWLKPDVAIDAHTLSNSIVSPASETNVVHIGAPNGQVAEAMGLVPSYVIRKARQQYSNLFASVPPSALESSIPNNATFRSYSYYEGCECSILVEVNNAILGTSATLNSTAAISISAYQLKEAVFALAKYNLENYKNR